MNNKKIIVLLVITFITVGAMIGILEWKNENPLLDTKASIIIEDQKINDEKKSYVDHTGIYIPYDVVKDYLCEDIYLDKDQKRVYIDLKNKDIVLEEDSLSDFIKNNDININIPTKRIENIVYVQADLLSKIFESNIQYIEDNNTVVINHFSQEKKEDKQLNKTREDFDTDGEKINLVWEYVHEKSKDLSKESKIESLDVIVPTWFSISNTEGKVINNGDESYVKEAHKKGYKVWGLVDNSFDPQLTSTILNNEQLRKKVIGQLLVYASLYDLDGINIDFENVYYEDQEKLVKFVEEIKYYTKKQNLVLSMDITVPSTSKRWSKVYDREALGNIVDYMAIMTYDEHWASSPVSGSVASIGWVEKGIVNTLKSIPEEKVLIGLPFYTRTWKESKDQNGNIKVESKAISMTYAKKIIEEKNATIIWNEEAGQYYAQYNEEDAVYKIWLEDPRSIALKVSLVEKYNLAGTASWRRGYEDVEVWAVLQEIIKKGKTYAELGFNE